MTSLDYLEVMASFLFILKVIVHTRLPACMSLQHMCTVLTECQKRALDLLEMELPAAMSHHMGCWELNPGPMEDQPMLLIAELFL